MDRERPHASNDSEQNIPQKIPQKIPEAWIGQEIMLETTEVISGDLRAGAPVYLEDVNERGIVVLVARHHGHRVPHGSSRYFYPWSVVGWIRLAEEEEK